MQQLPQIASSTIFVKYFYFKKAKKQTDKQQKPNKQKAKQKPTKIQNKTKQKPKQTTLPQINKSITTTILNFLAGN